MTDLTNFIDIWLGYIIMIWIWFFNRQGSSRLLELKQMDWFFNRQNWCNWFGFLTASCNSGTEANMDWFFNRQESSSLLLELKQVVVF